MALSCPLSLPTIQDMTMKCVGFLKLEAKTNPPDSVISSPKTKGSVIPQAKWSLLSEDSANVLQGRTNVNIQSTPVEWAVRKGGGGLTCHARLNRSPSGAPHQFQHVLYVQSISALLFSP